jgi:hypothetical protein
MVLYRCPRCGFQNKIKTKMRNHYYRKKPCETSLSDISIPECLDLLKGNSLKIPENIPENIPKNPEISLKTLKTLKTEENIPKNPENIPEKISQKPKTSDLNNNKFLISFPTRRKTSRNGKRYKCSFCSKTFTRKDNLRVHINQYCKTIDKYDEYSDDEDDISYEESIQDNSIIENLKTQLLLERVNRERDQEIINDLRKQVGTLIEKVGDTYNTNTYNIVINPFGKENTSYITKDYIKKIINEGPYDSIPKLLEYIHFNPKHKENHNIKITNKKQPYAQIYDGKNWLLKDKKQTIDHMSDKAYSLLNEHYAGGNTHMNKFKTEYDVISPELNKRIYKDVELTILNFQKNK